MNRRRQGRHAPAFILLFLAEGPSYGAALLSRLEKELPYCSLDSPGFYRALQNLEEAKAVAMNWETSDIGVPRKIYTITTIGLESLADEARDIRQSQENLRFFMDRYQILPGVIKQIEG